LMQEMRYMSFQLRKSFIIVSENTKFLWWANLPIGYCWFFTLLSKGFEQLIFHGCKCCIFVSMKSVLLNTHLHVDCGITSFCDIFLSFHFLMYHVL
jgi:hypothetical protein